MEYKNYSKPFLYSVPTLSNSYDLTTYGSVWDAIEKEAKKAIKIPDNVEEIRDRHQKTLDSLIKKGYYRNLSEKTFSENNYYKHFIILLSLKEEFFLGLRKYGYNVENDVKEYYKKLSLHETYLRIAVFCATNYHPYNFKHVDIPKSKHVLSKKGDMILIKSQNKIDALNVKKQQTDSQSFKIMCNSRISQLENYVAAIERNAFSVKNYNPEQAMKIFLHYVNEIVFASVTFLKKVITYHLQQQKGLKATYNKDRRNYYDRLRKRKMVTLSDIHFNVVSHYFKENPNSSIVLASEQLYLDRDTITRQKERFKDN